MQNDLTSLSSNSEKSVNSDENRHVAFKTILVHPEEKNRESSNQ